MTVALMLAVMPALAQRNDARSASIHVMRGVELYQAGKKAEAAEQFLAAIADNPKDDAAHYYLGYLATEQNNAADAYRYFNTAFQLDSTNTWYRMRLGSLFAAIGRNAQARQVLEPLLETKSGDLDLLSTMVEINTREGNYDKADSLITRMEMITGPSDFTEYSRIELSRMKGDFKAFFEGMSSMFASPYMKPSTKIQWIEDVMQRSDPRFNGAHIDDYDRLVQTCLEMHPTDTSVTHFAAKHYYSLERFPELFALQEEHSDDEFLTRIAMYAAVIKLKDYRKTLEYTDILWKMTDDADMRADLISIRSECYFNLGDNDSAIRECEHLLRLKPDNIPTLNNCAYYMSITGGNLKKALKMSRKTIEAEPENATYLDTYGWILYLQRKYSQAKIYLKKAVLYGGKESATVLEHYAETLKALGDTATAEVYFNKAKLKKDAGQN